MSSDTFHLAIHNITVWRVEADVVCDDDPEDAAPAVKWAWLITDVVTYDLTPHTALILVDADSSELLFEDLIKPCWSISACDSTNACHVEPYHHANDCSLLWLRFRNSEERTRFERVFRAAAATVGVPPHAATFTAAQVTDAVFRVVELAPDRASFQEGGYRVLSPEAE